MEYSFCLFQSPCSSFFSIQLQSHLRILSTIRSSLRDAMGTRLPLKVKYLTVLEKPVGAAMIMIKSPTDTISSRAERMEPVKSSSAIHSIPSIPGTYLQECMGG